MIELQILKEKGGIGKDKNYLMWALDRGPIMEDVLKIKTLNNEKVQKSRHKSEDKTQVQTDDLTAQDNVEAMEVISGAAISRLPESPQTNPDVEMLRNISNGIYTLLGEIKSIREEMRDQSSVISKTWANMDTVLTAMQGRFEEFIPSK